jgi:hypothetical protein
MTDRVKDLEAKLVAMKARDEAKKLELRAESKALTAELRTMKAKERAAEIDRKVAAVKIAPVRNHIRSLYQAADHAPAFQTYSLAGKQRTAHQLIDAFVDALNNPTLLRTLGFKPSNGAA